MKTIGLIGGTSWPSTLNYYRLLNQNVQSKLGGFHSAKIILYSIDYHDIKSRYQGGWDEIPELLKKELLTLINMNPDCLILCNNALHKALDQILSIIPDNMPLFHAIDCVGKQALVEQKNRLLLLGTQFTMEDGFYKNRLEKFGLNIVIPNESERKTIQAVQTQLSQNIVKPDFTEILQDIIHSYKNQIDGVVLGCTELPMVITPQNSPCDLLNPIELQCEMAVKFALE